MSNCDIYLYGMTLVSTMHLLGEEFPQADSYSEIKESYDLPGGETGSCAVVLSSLGCRVKLDGNHQGARTAGILKSYLADRYGVDMSRVFEDPDFDGVRDMILIAGNTRTVFGTFGAYFNSGVKRWNAPVRADVVDAEIVGLDPFFAEQSERVVQYCRELGKKYVTIDCKPDSILHRFSEVNVVSNEFIQNNFSGMDIEELFRRYTDNTDGLVIFTFGAGEILFGRRNQHIQSFRPYKVRVQSTLGAGDSFKAGAIYGVFKKMPDPELVSFAAATAATVCSRFPLALNPPDLDMINGLINKK